MKITIKPTGNKCDQNGTTYDILNVSVGSVVLGRIIGNSVLSGSHVVMERTMPDKLAKLTGCTREDAIAALGDYSARVESDEEDMHFSDNRLTKEELLRERSAAYQLALSLYELVAGEAPNEMDGTFELLSKCIEILEASSPSD